MRQVQPSAGRLVVIRHRFAVALLGVILFQPACAGAAEQSDPTANSTLFAKTIRPILADHCFTCHGPDASARQMDLRLDRREDAMAAGAIVPGDSKKSKIILRIFAAGPDERMPPAESKKQLSAEQKEALRAWIDRGAPYGEHWSFVKIPRRIPVPTPADPSHWIGNPIDAFVLDRLKREGMRPAPSAERSAWLRRVTFDLTGLPPTLDEIDAFLADGSPDAKEKVVDRLLASPAFAERMAIDWLDAARYADTFGYQADRDMHVWPWRDWLIRSFQTNLPFDQFVAWQTAGDLLPNPTQDQLIATAFNRLHRQTNEGGSIDEEFRIESIADRVKTNGTTFLGLTMECARCHDHKYDPISQREYYQFAAFFGSIDEFGTYSHFTETAPTPAALLYQGDQAVRHRELLDAILSLEDRLEAIGVVAKRRFRPDAIASESTPTADYSNTFDDIKEAGDYRPVPGKFGQAVEFGGDDPFICKDAGDFGRTDPFTFSLWVKPAVHEPRMVVLHRSRAAEDSAFRGYALTLDEGAPTFSLIHFWPGNAIRVKGRSKIETGRWTHLAVAYDGSSKAAGLRIFIDGKAAERATPLNPPLARGESVGPPALDVVRDCLTRDIQHRAEWGDYDAGSVQLALGARFRDAGFKRGAVDELRVFGRELSAIEVARLAGIEPPSDEASRFEHLLLHDKQYQAARDDLRAARVEENKFVSSIRQIMVMRELDSPRPAYVLRRGDYSQRGDRVQPQTPAAISSLPSGFPHNRLGLARWLAHEDNPLTARVAVNRYWRIFFGRGIVATPEDFGTQGQLPSHPELIDWLARRFVSDGWNVRSLCRLIALSSTYGQSSTPRGARSFAVDPENRLLARGPRHRLGAEQLRDNVLAMSGLLVPKIGGKSVMPYQPAGIWEESGTGKVYQQSHGEDLYRRSMYTFWRRTSPPPSMSAFDAPTREVCNARREETASPLQALIFLNDVQFVEAARVLAGRLLHEHGEDGDAALLAAFRLTTSRQPSAEELNVLRKLYAEQRARFAAAPESAPALLSVGEYPRAQSIDPIAHAALTAVVQALFSFDECMSKR